MECVKAKAWKDFVVKNSIVPPAYDRLIQNNDNPTPFCLSLKYLEGIEVVKYLEIKLLLNTSQNHYQLNLMNYSISLILSL